MKSKEEVAGGWRKLHNVELHKLYASPSGLTIWCRSIIPTLIEISHAIWTLIHVDGHYQTKRQFSKLYSNCAKNYTKLFHSHHNISCL